LAEVYYGSDAVPVIQTKKDAQHIAQANCTQKKFPHTVWPNISSTAVILHCPSSYKNI